MRRIALVVALAFLWIAPNADAKPKAGAQVAKKLGGRVFVSDKYFPTSAKSEAAFIAKVTKNKKDKIWEDKENKVWHLHLAAFFKKALPDLEYNVKIYDLTNGAQEYKDSVDQYADSSDQPSVNFDLELAREKYGPNRKLMIVIESGSAVMAAGRVQILGEAEHYSGKVDFSKDEGDGDDGQAAKNTDTDSSDGQKSKPKKGTK
jgi:hypothetical protein